MTTWESGKPPTDEHLAAAWDHACDRLGNTLGQSQQALQAIKALLVYADGCDDHLKQRLADIIIDLTDNR